MPESFVTCRPIESEAEREEAYAIRTEVFVVEQGCPIEEELDEHDAVAQHFVALLEGKIVGTARAYEIEKGVVKIGRVAVQRKLRGRGIGAALMEVVGEWGRARGFREGLLHAQTYVIPFYERLGYVAGGDVFYEAYIPHRKMRKKL
jgi:predicted GNAT family N-acyltransferase